jgi:hypothetical protein
MVCSWTPNGLAGGWIVACVEKSLVASHEMNDDRLLFDGVDVDVHSSMPMPISMPILLLL